MRIIFRLVFVFSISFFANTAIAGCAGSLPSGSQRAINAGNPNHVLFSKTVMYFANVERCKRGLTPFTSDPALLQAATGHSNYMARANNMTHTSNLRGYRTLRDRMRAANVSMRTAGENIAQNFVFALGGRSISLATRGACKFTYADTRQAVPQHSYQSLAQEQMANWMASSKHYENLMNRRFSRMAASLGYAPENATCGRFYITQDFAG